MSTIENLPLETTPGSTFAVEALNTYTNLLPENLQSRSSDHPRRVASILKAFAGDNVPSLVYDAALLHDVADRYVSSADTEISDSATTSLAEYFSNSGQENSLYVACLLADLDTIELTAEEYRKQIAKEDQYSQFSSIITNGYTDPLPPELWLIDSPDTDLEKMSVLLQGVNLESVLIKAAELLDNLLNPPQREAALLHDILEAEYFYAPLLEVIGYDGFAMSLRDISAQIRCNKSGNDDIVLKAKQIHDTAMGVSVEGLFEKIGIDSFIVTDVVKPLLERGHVSTGEFTFEQTGDLVKGNWRIKSVGSLALKLLRQNGDVPMDVLALTVIEKDVDSVGFAFSSLINTLRQKSDKVSFRKAPSKDKPLYVQGSDEYTQIILDSTQSNGIDSSDIQQNIVDNGKFEVAKLTFDLTHDRGITPVEVQFVTEDARKDSRIGETAHILFKNGYKSTVENQTELLKAIHDRKRRLDKGAVEVNGQTKQRGFSFLSNFVS
jgi:hypothetical protein